MAKWTLSRQIFGCEEFSLSEGEEVTIGRAATNSIILSSAVISRNHCVIKFQNINALITDLQSANGVYVGSIRIPKNKPYVIEDNDLIGLGWTMCRNNLTNIADSEKYIFKLSKDKTASLTNRLTFQSDTELDDIEAKIAKIDGLSDDCTNIQENKSPVLCNKQSLKRNNKGILIEEGNNGVCFNASVINISDSDSDIHSKPPAIVTKKPKLQAISEEQKLVIKDNEVKIQNELVEYDPLKVKQEYLGYDDAPIEIDSDNDSDSESEQWLLRLSQNSPGKPFTKIAKTMRPEVKTEDSSYSQIDDDFICGNNLTFDDDDDEFVDDIISIPQSAEKSNEVPDIDKSKQAQLTRAGGGDDEYSDDIISIQPSYPTAHLEIEDKNHKDEPDGFNIDSLSNQTEKLKSPLSEPFKRAQMIEPLAQLPKSKSRIIAVSAKKNLLLKHNEIQNKPSTKVNISKKEERKKKLKELAVKDKNESLSSRDSPTTTKRVTNVKVTSSNRGAFLTDLTQAVVKPVKRKEESNKSKDQTIESPIQKEANGKEDIEIVRQHKIDTEKSNKDKSKSSKHRERKAKGIENKSHNAHKTSQKSEQDTRVPLKSLRPLTDSDESVSGKPVSKVGPMPSELPKKKVRFSETAPQIIVFEIEPGNKMKKTSLVKTSLVDVRQTPVYSLSKITLMKILRWNPHWLEEQLNNNEPPPILGHNNTPMTLFHSFVNHHQYVQLVGDLLLMEIWECLTIAYNKIRQQNTAIHMKVESLPPIPSQERSFDLFNLCVNVSLLPSETRNLPRVGEIMLITFGPENAKNQRFFFVHNIRYLPPAQGQTSHFYSISLHATVTEKMMLLRPGEIIIGKSVAYINNELMLFEAMEYLAGSPLSEAILKPEPHHFVCNHTSQPFEIKSRWTATLNPSQLKAVYSSVAAALSDKPSIQMVQGPPGTGKSSVICAIVMTYFYNAQGKKQQNRGKLLICATSNAAVDGLVIRLLNLRQSLPKPERFRMVRVGRAAAMHALAADVSSQQLAARDLARPLDAPPPAPGLSDEILHLEAKINMWKSAADNAKDPVRVAYCQNRAKDYIKRITLLRSGSGTGAGRALRPEQLAATERRIIEGADIIVTTLASAQNPKMKGLKRRIALCIIDEAGQVIEPETLIPLTLDVTRLTLIGDPQQLPGFICSQRAKKHGLSESLFSRLASCTDEWPDGSPVVLLNKQYRMHPEIADYPSRAFYGGMVDTIPPIRPNIDIPPYTIISISSGDKGQDTFGANEMEAWGVSRLVLALDSLLRPLSLSLAVITPYNAHKDLIKKHLKALHNQREAAVEVNTADSFQGQERDVVVVSLARSQGVGFLTDAGRMNVMLTRAKHALFICLNPFALMKNNQWRTLVEDAQRRDLYKSLPNKLCQPISAAQVSNDDILKYIIDKNNSKYDHR